MEQIKLTIDDRPVEVEKGTPVIQAAKKLGIEIPALCYMDLGVLGYKNNVASCRVCVVEIEGRKNLAPACNTEAADGMEIRTNTLRVLNARKTNLELILSDHPQECLTCFKSGHCELQDLAVKMGIREIPYAGETSNYAKDTSSASIERETDKCIMCRRCETMCSEKQSVGALSAVERGFEAVVATAFNTDLVDTECTFCGQCVAVCPTGALIEKDDTDRVIEALNDSSKTVVVQVAPAIRVALGEEFGLERGTPVTGKMVAALKSLNFDYVFDTDFAADLTIMEEASELLDRVKKVIGGDDSVKLPLLTSCCPAWVNFYEKQFPDLLDHPSTAKSPMQMFGSVAKSYFADMIDVKREDMVVVAVMPCLAKKSECAREEFTVDGNPDVDISITTRELGRLLKKANINFADLPDAEFDKPLGEATGAAVIFGATGGVIEAAARSAYEFYTGESLEKVDFEALRGFDGIRRATVDFNGLDVNIGIAHGLRNARKLLEDVRAGKSEFHAIEVMACPGGCIGGAGQPYHNGCDEVLKARHKAIYNADSNMKLRKSHENPDVQKLYDDFLGEPLSHKAHELLHTHYFDRSKK